MSARYLGLDLGGTNTNAVVVENQAHNRTWSPPTVPTPAADGPLAVIERLVAGGNRLIAEHGPPARTVRSGM